jgi:hypothetical protein
MNSALRNMLPTTQVDGRYPVLEEGMQQAGFSSGAICSGG